MSRHTATQPNQTQAAELRASGLRVTVARRTVLEWLMDHPHATAEQVHAGVLERIGSTSKQAVYDVLAACVDVGLIRQIKPAGHPARFERRAGDNHHHLVCRQCGCIADTDCHTHHAPCLEPTDPQGFAVDEAEVVFWGLCARCRPDRSTSTGHAGNRSRAGQVTDEHSRNVATGNTANPPMKGHEPA